MRNLKKILALALVFAMTFTFASAANFSDQATIGADYVDDVNMLVELGVIGGYPDGTFGPEKNITRAEFAKMAYTLKYGSDADGNLFAAQACAFTDVAADHWAKGYINYCYNQKIVSGVGNNKYNPNGNITVAEATKMILVIMGCNPEKEGFIGANWQANVVAKAIDLGVFDGWTGDPTKLATRQLVAKLMRNAIFSPVYEYSAISGIGSQMDALGQNYNQTLGEKTMGLFHVEGIVVANERFALETDEEGEALDVSVKATGDEEESVIYYTVKDITGDEHSYTITIDRGLSDELLGNKVDVYFKADASKDRASGLVTGYKNIEVLGNVIVNSDTVVYTVDAVDTDVYPDGDSSSKTEVLPYISFKVDGVEKKILADKELVGKYAKSEDAQVKSDVIDAFNKYAYLFDTELNSDNADLKYYPDARASFIDDMGEKVLSQYRFVSVDGGKTYSYMFKTVDDVANNKVAYGSVTNYSEAKGTITLTGIGSQDLEDCVVAEGIAVDDAVVYYRNNGKIVVNKVEVITGAVAGFTDDEGVIIGDKTLYAWDDCEDVYGGYSSLFEYYTNNKNAQNEATTYYVYNNLIMEIDADEAVAAVENYAVILRAYYDEDMDTAYVKLGFADNTEGTYKIGKYYLKKASEPNNAVNDRPQDFANNAFFGAVVKYNIRTDGSVDLSGQYFKDIEAGTAVTKYKSDITSAGVYEEQFQDWDGKPYYGLNDASVVFALYGFPCYTAGGKIDATVDGFSPIKAKAYKLNELKEINAKAIEDLCVGTESPADYAVASYVLNTKSGNSQYVVAAAMTVGSKLENISYKESRALAYVVSAMQRYNGESGKYYAEFTLINEDGLFTAATIEDVTDLNANSALEDDYIGKLSAADGKFPAGTFLRYDIDANKVLTAIDNTDLLKANISTSLKYTGSVVSNGLYLINVTNERNGVLSFFETASAVDPQNGKLMSLKFHEDGYKVVGIDDDAYVGETITKVSTRQSDNLEAGIGNAIIEVDEGQIVRIFSFIDGYSK